MHFGVHQIGEPIYNVKCFRVKLATIYLNNILCEDYKKIHLQHQHRSIRSPKLNMLKMTNSLFLKVYQLTFLAGNCANFKMHKTVKTLKLSCHLVLSNILQ